EDYTTVQGSKVEPFFTPPPGRKVEALVGVIESQTNYAHGKGASGLGGADPVEAGPGGPVGQWVFSGFEGNKAAGTDTQLTVHFNWVRIVTTETSNCVPATAAAQAQRLQQLSPSTAQRLEAPLRGTPAEILNL